MQNSENKLKNKKINFGIVVFPGTWSDVDCYNVVTNVLHQSAKYVLHKDTDLSEFDCIILPGGFSYGDYLRTGAIAKFSPVMNSLKDFAESGKLILGICNGFQILCESGLLPGTLIRNNNLKFKCSWENLRVENINSPFTNSCLENEIIKIPISHGEGNYFADSQTLQELNKNNQIIFKYSSPSGEISNIYNPNGSLENIAGISNKNGNVLGMLPHPERCCEKILGGTDGKKIFTSILTQLATS